MKRRFDVILHPLPADGYKDDGELLVEAEWMLSMLLDAYMWSNNYDRRRIIGRVDAFLPHLRKRIPMLEAQFDTAILP